MMRNVQDDSLKILIGTNHIWVNTFPQILEGGDVGNRLIVVIVMIV